VAGCREWTSFRQVLLGNTKDIGYLKESFDPVGHTVSNTAAAVGAAAGTLIPSVEKVTRPRICAEAIEDDEQSPTVNQQWQCFVVDFMYHL